MKQGLADISVPERDTADSQGSHQEYIMKERFFTSKTADFIQIQFVYIHENHTGSHKKHQLDQRMIHHMEQAAPHGKNVIFAEQTRHACAYQNKADLGDGRAGQCPFQVYGKQCQQGTDYHSKYAKEQNQAAPEGRAQKQAGCQD